MALGVERETAERDACELEHSVSPESFLAIREALDGRRCRTCRTNRPFGAVLRRFGVEPPPESGYNAL